MGLPPPAGGHLREPRPLELDTADGPVDAAPRRFGQIESGRAAEQLCDLLLVREIRSKRQTTHRVIHRPPTDLVDESLGFAATVLCITHVRSKRSDGGSETRRSQGRCWEPRNPRVSRPDLGRGQAQPRPAAGYRQRFATASAQHLGELPYLRLSLGEVLTIWHVPVQGMDFRHAGRLLRPAWLLVTTRDKHYSLPSQSEMASRGAIRPDGLSRTSP